jgi:hypothetical protein
VCGGERERAREIAACSDSASEKGVSGPISGHVRAHTLEETRALKDEKEICEHTLRTHASTHSLKMSTCLFKSEQEPAAILS